MRVKMQIRVDFVECKPKSEGDYCNECELHESCSNKVSGLHETCCSGDAGFFRLLDEAYGVLAGADNHRGF